MTGFFHQNFQDSFWKALYVLSWLDIWRKSPSDLLVCNPDSQIKKLRTHPFLLLRPQMCVCVCVCVCVRARVCANVHMRVHAWEKERIQSRLQAPSCQSRAWHGARTHRLRDHDLSRSRTHKIESQVGLCANSGEPAWDSPSLPLCLPLPYSHSLCFSQNK